MNAGFYSSKSGILAMQKGIDVVSNNVANVQTTGYKTIRANFSDLLYTSEKSLHSTEPNEQAQTGHGVRTIKTDLMYKNGQLMMTGRALDFCCPTDGFFAIKDEAGNTSYTRDGAFYISEKSTGKWALVNADGRAVLDYDGKEIEIELKEAVADAEGGTGQAGLDIDGVLEKIGVFTFANPFGLEAAGSNSYRQTASSGEAKADKELDKLSNALEVSTVDLADQMVKTIQLQRSFQLNAKLLQTSDDMESIINNLR